MQIQAMAGKRFESAFEAFAARLGVHHPFIRVAVPDIY
jgi:hypothetical protein